MGHPNNLGLPALLWGMVARSPSFWRLHAMAPTLQAVWDAAPTSFFMTFKFHGIIRRWKGSCHARLYQNIVPVWYMKWHWTDMIERVSCSLHHLVLWKSFEQGNKGDSSMQRWSRRIDVEQSAESKIESPDIVSAFTSHDLDWKGTWLFGSLLWKDAHPKAAVRMGSKVKIYHKLTIRHHLRLGFVFGKLHNHKYVIMQIHVDPDVDPEEGNEDLWDKLLCCIMFTLFVSVLRSFSQLSWLPKRCNT